MTTGETDWVTLRLFAVCHMPSAPPPPVESRSSDLIDDSSFRNLPSPGPFSVLCHESEF